jgi:hypothetical protein
VRALAIASMSGSGVIVTEPSSTGGVSAIACASALARDFGPLRCQAYRYLACLDRNKLRQTRLREGWYLLRTNLVEDDPAKLWSHYCC